MTTFFSFTKTCFLQFGNNEIRLVMLICLAKSTENVTQKTLDSEQACLRPGSLP